MVVLNLHSKHQLFQGRGESRYDYTIKSINYIMCNIEIHLFNHCMKRAFFKKIIIIVDIRKNEN
jgi:hypothetical protein